MMFKDIKQNYHVHILDKEHVKYMKGKVISVSFPRMMMMQGGAQQVVDVTIDCDGKTATYSIPEHLSVTYAGNYVLSTTVEHLAKEVESMKHTAEQIINSIDKQKEIVEKSSHLLTELNPSFKEKKDIEDRFNKIETNMTEMKNMLSSFIREFKN